MNTNRNYKRNKHKTQRRQKKRYRGGMDPSPPSGIETLPRPRVMMIVGRMNPPTPGHLDLCMHLLQEVERDALGGVGESLMVSAIRANIVPRIFLTNTNNQETISKLSAKSKSKYEKVLGLKVKGDSDGANIFDVKDKNLQNPLTSNQKKETLIQMILSKSKKDHPSWELKYEHLNEWIVTGEKCSTHLYTAIHCAISLTGEKNGERVTLYMGQDDTEQGGMASGRTDACIPIGPVHCQLIKRSGSDDKGVSMSGSTIRLLIANEEYDKVGVIYQELLHESQIQDLIRNVRKGLRMSPTFPSAEVSDPRAAEDTTSGRYTKRRKYRKRRR